MRRPSGLAGDRGRVDDTRVVVASCQRTSLLSPRLQPPGARISPPAATLVDILALSSAIAGSLPAHKGAMTRIGAVGAQETCGVVGVAMLGG